MSGLLPWIIGGVFLLAGAVVPMWSIGARKRAVEGAQARARTAYERLAFCVETVQAGDDPYATQLLADARERWHTTGAVLAGATTPGEYKVAEQTAQQGLRWIAEARRQLEPRG